MDAPEQPPERTEPSWTISAAAKSAFNRPGWVQGFGESAPSRRRRTDDARTSAPNGFRRPCGIPQSALNRPWRLWRSPQSAPDPSGRFPPSPRSAPDPSPRDGGFHRSAKNRLGRSWNLKKGCPNRRGRRGETPNSGRNRSRPEGQVSTAEPIGSARGCRSLHTAADGSRRLGGFPQAEADRSAFDFEPPKPRRAVWRAL